jgi:stage V sporulation protein B
LQIETKSNAYALLFLGDYVNIKSKYISSALLLLITSIIVKLIGAFYKIPLTAYIGAVGRGYFGVAYNLCLPIHAVIMGAFPVALSKITAKYKAQENKEALGVLKKSADKLFFAAGLIGMSLMLILSKPYCDLIASSPKSIYCVFALAPSILFSSLAASYRGYYEGFMNMRPTSVSQTIEAVFKLVFGLAFAKLSMAYLFNNYSATGMVLSRAVSSDEEALSLIYPLSSAAAIFGVSFGCFLSYIYVLIYHRINNPVGTKNFVRSEKYSGELLSFSFPIMFSCAVQSVFQFLDTASVQAALGLISTEDLRAAYSGGLTIAKTANEDVVSYVYGILSSAIDFKNLVPGITMALGVCAVPAVSSAFESKNKEHLQSLINSVYKYTALLSMAGGIIIALNSKSILELFYSNSAPDIVVLCEGLVKWFALSVPFYSLASASVFCVQAVGAPKKTIAPYVVSGIIRVILNILLVSNENFILFGNVISGAVGYFFMFLWNTKTLKRISGVKISKTNAYLKPTIIGLLSFFSFNYLLGIENFSKNSAINLLIGTTLFGAFFCMLCLLFKVLIFNDVFCLFKIKKNGLNT